MLKVAKSAPGVGALVLAVLTLTGCGVGVTPTTALPQSGSTSSLTPTYTETPSTPSKDVTEAAGGKTCAGIPLASVRLDTMGLPYPWQPNCVPATPYDKSQPATPTGIPEHLEINFGNIDPKNVKPNDPIIYVIPVAEYKKLWDANDDPSVTVTLVNLGKMLIDKPEPMPTSGMPVLPVERATGRNDLAVQGKYLTIQSGNGVRFVGRFTQSPVPVSNDNPQLFYIYQGYSARLTYLVSFFYPVSTKALPMSTEVTEAERQQVDADPMAYTQSKVQQLNALSESDWNPNLSQLDAVINSLRFGN